MLLQSLPVEVLCRVFGQLDYESLQLFEANAGVLLRQLSDLARSMMAGYHAFVTNYNTRDFSVVPSSQYIRNIARIIDAETANLDTPCAFCRHTRARYHSNIHIALSFQSLSVAPNILTVYLIYPGRDSTRSSVFSNLIREFIGLVGQRDNLAWGINTINFYIDYDEFLLNESAASCEFPSSIIDLSLYRLLHDLELAAFTSDLLKTRLNIFSVITHCQGVRFHGLVDTGVAFSDSMREYVGLTHLSLPHHVFSDPDILLGKATRAMALPQNLNSLNLSFSTSLTRNLLRFNAFPNTLEHLNLSGTELGDYLETSALRLPYSVKFLNISNNKIRTLTNLKLPAFLVSLDLSQNYLTDLMVCTGNRRFCPYLFSPGLKNLNLSYNHLMLIEGFAFPVGLVRLSLAANFIQDISTVCFPHALSYIDLSLNKLSAISLASLPTTLQDLDVSDNEISHLVREPWAAKLRMLNLSGNPLADVNFLVHTGQRRDEMLPYLMALFLNNINLVEAFRHTLASHKCGVICFPRALQYLHMTNTGIRERDMPNVHYGPAIKVLNMS